SITTLTARRSRMISIAGLLTVTAEKKIQFRRATCPATRWVIPTSTITARGPKSLTTARFGIRVPWRWAGLLIVMDIGATLGLGAGLGLTTRLGALRHFTTDAGIILAGVGAGAPDRSAIIQFTDRLSLDSSAAALALELESEWVGSRWVLVRFITRGMA